MLYALSSYEIPYPDGSVFYSEMPPIYRQEADALIVGPHGLLSHEAQVQMTSDVGYITVFAGYKLKTDKRETGFHLAGL